MADEVATIDLCIVSHTNAGKTTLARTLLGREIGEVRDQPHVTEIAESHVLLETPQGDVLRLWDTPGFGDSVRLVKRLMLADNPIGWMLRELWDRFRDRPFWCSQQRCARRAGDRSCSIWLMPRIRAMPPMSPRRCRFCADGKPVLLLLNQVGPPNWLRRNTPRRKSVPRRASCGVREVLTLDAFARRWVRRCCCVRSRRCWRRKNARLRACRLHGGAQRGPLPPRWPFSPSRLRGLHATASRCPAAPAGSAAGAEVLSLARARTRHASAPSYAGRTARSRNARCDAAAHRLHGLEGNATAIVLQRVREHLADTGRIAEGRARAGRHRLGRAEWSCR
jgi:hypothetical protein